MKLRVLSDLHNEFVVLDLPIMEDEKEQVLLLAGDIDLAKDGESGDRLVTFLEAMSNRFKEVCYIAGNHEFYRTRYDKAIGFLHNATAHIPNFTFVDSTRHYLGDGVVLVGATLWTDMGNHDQLVMQDSANWMNDYRVIKYNDKGIFRRLKPLDTVAFHLEQKKFLFNVIREEKEEGNKVVVMTHHGPSWLSVPECYAGNPVNGAYVSALDEHITETNPELWIHGHTHTSFDYRIGDTRVVTNPRGYASINYNPSMDEWVETQENVRFDPLLTIEV